LYKILAKTLILGKKVVFLPTCHSTNTATSELLKTSSLIEGTLVITNDQTAGQGQRGNQWESQSGKNLTFSIVLRPGFVSVEKQFSLTMCVALGITDYLNQITRGFLVKWPNDIYYKNRKVCGILIQNSLKGNMIANAVVGIGLNVNQVSFGYPRAVSLKNIIEKELDLTETLEGICEHIEKRYLQLKLGEGQNLKRQYLNNLLGFGEHRVYSDGTDFSGYITDVHENGKLEIERHDGARLYGFKEVEFVFD